MPIHRRLSHACAVLLLLSFATSPSQAQAPQGGPPAVKRSIEKITESVYRATNNTHNTVFLVTPEGIVLADPINRDFAEWFKAEAAKQFNVPVKYVLYSHHHFDHASGGEVFADTAQFVAQANMLKYLAMPPASTKLKDITGEFEEVAQLDKNGDNFVDKEEAKGKVNDAQFALYDANKDGKLSGPEVARGPLSDVYAPKITYQKEWEIKFGGHRVHMTALGNMNHSNDSSLITFPDDSVLFVCDYADVGRLPYKDMDYENGQLDEWIAAVKRTETVGANYKYVAAGHGRLGTVADLTAWRGYVEELRAQVKAGLARGESLEQLKASIKMEKYSDWIGYNQKGWVEDNVTAMYHFLTDKPGAKKPAG